MHSQHSEQSAGWKARADSKCKARGPLGSFCKQRRTSNGQVCHLQEEDLDLEVGLPRTKATAA